mgnify:CR=1 FL=1
MASRFRKSLRVTFLVFLLLAAAGCSLTPTRSTKVADNWSRGLRLGAASVPQPVALAVSDRGERVHLAWSLKKEEGRTALCYVQLNGQGQVTAERDLTGSLLLPRESQLVVDGGGTLHLLGLARLHSGEPDGLYHVPLNLEGEPLATPTRLSAADEKVAHFQALPGRGGEVLLFWASKEGTSPGVYYRRLEAGTAGGGAATLVVPEGTNPTFQVDAQGGIHLAWLQARRGDEWEVRYAFFPNGQVGPVEGMPLTTFFKALGTLLQRPDLGLDEGWVYVFWSLEYRSGLNAGSAETDWVTFPVGHPEQSKVSRVMLPGAATGLPLRRGGTPTWQFRITQATGKVLPDMIELPSEGVQGPSDYVYMPTVAPGQEGQLLVGLSLMVQYRTRSNVQPALALFADGRLVAYQIAGQTRDFSLYPHLLTDEKGDLHLAWMDQAEFGRYEVYYATTAEAARAELDRLDATDVAVGVFDTVWGMLSGLTLIPIFVSILFLPLLWVGAYYVLGPEDDLEEKAAKIALAVALLLYLGAKLVVLGPMLAQVPFVSQIPSALAPLWLWGMPLLLLILAALALFFYVRRAGRPSLFGGFFVFVITDALLTLLAYGPAFFAGG